MKKPSYLSKVSSLIGSDAETPTVAEAAVSTDRPRARAPAVGMAAAAMNSVIDERDRLSAEITSGRGRVVEIDPDLIDPSPFSDRLPDDDDLAYTKFRQSIQEAGQKVPAEVRNHPSASGRYQTIYGHRRIRAAKELGIKVKAVISDVSDRDHLMAQALENNERQDLSWSEKALFVLHMDANGISTADIATAVGLDKSRVSELRATAKAMPADVIRAIGRAMKAGRPKWKTLEAAFAANPEVSQRSLEILSDAAARGLSSDERFLLLLSALQITKPGPTKTILVSEIGKAVTSAVGEDDRTDFAEFVRHEIPAMVKRFYAVRRAPTDDN